ncbi:MAG: TlpA family protein disulfide reductase [Chitinophagales bacterium]
MRFLLTTIFLFIFYCLWSQEIDSVWTEKYAERLARDTGFTLDEPYLIDNNGQRRSLSEFRGKILYIDVWTTWCVNCLGNFPHSKKLFERLRSIHLDTAIQFITICTEGSKSKWKKLLKKYIPEGITLYTTDTSIYKSWHVEGFPKYILLDRDGKVIASDAPNPDDGLIDYILYAAVQNINPVTAIWIDFRQQGHFRKNQSYTNDNEGIEYAKWYYSTNQLRYKHWLEQHDKKNSR